MWVKTVSQDSLDNSVQWCTLIDQLYSMPEEAVGATGAVQAQWQRLLSQVARFIGIQALNLEWLDEGPGLYGTTASDEWIVESPRLAVKSDPMLYHGRLGYCRLTAKHDHALSEWHRERVCEFSRHCFQYFSLLGRFFQLNEEIKALYDALHSLPWGVVLLDAGLKPVFSNRFAAELTDRYDDLSIDRNRIAYWVDGKDCLSHRLFKFDREFEWVPGRIKRCYFEPLQMTFYKLHSSTLSDLICQEFTYCLFLDERFGGNVLTRVKNAPEPITQYLQRHYELTPREIQLAYNLSLGLTVAQYADLSRRSVLTVRSQKKSVYRKLNINDQKSLIKLIWKNDMGVFLDLFCQWQHQGEDSDIVYPALR